MITHRRSQPDNERLRVRDGHMSHCKGTARRICHLGCCGLVENWVYMIIKTSECKISKATYCYHNLAEKYSLLFAILAVLAMLFMVIFPKFINLPNLKYLF